MVRASCWWTSCLLLIGTICGANQMPQVSAGQVPQVSSIRSVGQNCIGSACNQMPQTFAGQVPQVSSIRSVRQNCVGSACNQMPQVSAGQRPQVSANQVPQVSSGYWNDEIAAEDGFPAKYPFDESQSTWTIALSGKDLVILGLLFVTVLNLIILCFTCAKSHKAGGSNRKRYQPVMIDSEVERVWESKWRLLSTRSTSILTWRIQGSVDLRQLSIVFCSWNLNNDRVYIVFLIQSAWWNEHHIVAQTTFLIIHLRWTIVVSIGFFLLYFVVNPRILILLL